MMHPAIRIVVLLVLASALPDLNLIALATLLALLLGAQAAAGGAADLRRALGAMWRLRWLLLAIAVLYLGSTRGEPQWSALPGISHDGLLESARRSLLLLNLIAAAQLLVLRTPVEDLVGALAWLARPLALVKIETRRFALRLGLALEQARAVQLDFSAARAGRSWTELAADAIRRVEDPTPVAAAPLAADLPAPPPWQWLAPALLFALLHAWPG